jgi:predicted amidohydrolase YtcJ
MNTRDQLFHGKVVSLDGLGTRPALGIAGERITGVGDAASVAAGLNDPTVLEFGERSLLPGFIDTHAHSVTGAIGVDTMVDCVNTCNSIDDMQQQLRDHLDTVGESGWMVARGLLMLDQRWSDGRYPTREDLDRVSTTVPIAVRTGHLAILNTRALEVVGIEKYIGVKHGGLGPGSVQMGSDGQPNGRLNNLEGIVPLPEPDAATMRRSVETGIRRVFTSKGVTTICELSDTMETTQVLLDLIDEGRIGPRYNVFLMVPATMTLEQALNWRATGLTDRPGRYDIRGIKLFADGGYGSYDAAVNHVYCECVALEPGSKGILSFADSELADVLTKIAGSGMQVAIHTNGERSQEQVCRVARSIDRAGDPPMRLEHAGNWVWDPKTPDLWRSAGALPSSQPSFLWTMAAGMPGLFGESGRRHGRLPFRTLLEQGWDLPGGSDWIWPWEEAIADPFFSMWCCMKRMGFDGELIDPDEAIDFEAALKMQTINGARLLGEEANRGSLEGGKLADIVVVDRDLSKGVTADNVRDIQVDYVFRGGELVHAREGAAPYRVGNAVP